MIRIIKLEVLSGRQIRFQFSDNKEKVVDFTSFIRDDALSSPLAQDDYFRRVKLYEDGRGIYWPNEFDFCPDFLYQYQPDELAIPK